ncbi:hypothetical protein SERLA73DRAFT_144097 [Serpula lacrymans var. lacrymans S7.3]|uniref:Uncharacterized protein n=1 Tax=Serpula lacrymans var. lacrymans (strain S7.3) TaxID=936435 RepID=F8QB16_SERL3|nr:hypothetical protein SERLA73DRAFT_144097 [Serpula lacrymans var. lacrymans S7.3]
MLLSFVFSQPLRQTTRVCFPGACFNHWPATVAGHGVMRPGPGYSPPLGLTALFFLREG